MKIGIRHENETLLTPYKIINIYFSEKVPWELKTHRRLYNSLILICYHIYSKIYIIYSYQYLFQSFLIFNIHYIYKNKNICWLEGFILNNEFSCLLEDNISSRSISSFRIIQALRNNFKIFRDYAGNVRRCLPAFLC